MASKVTCTCGWSWNKSDSSKKDVYVCHNCGKDNTMKNGGWLSKYNSPEAQNGIEGTMAGLTDKGFNYNGAWGGTMAMGGSLPGSVGFTYARTQDPAPSNGPYAKKTKASAQKGKTITKREDFEPWWNWASVQAAGGERRQQTYGNLGDLYAYYAGQPLKHNVLEHSQYKPTDAKNLKADYISINDSKFKQEVIDNYNRVFNEKKLLRDEKQLNDNTYAVSGYTRPRKEQMKKSKSGELYYEKGKDHVSNAIGHYYLSKGKDEKGDYVSYYDVFDEGTGGSNGVGVGEILSLTKPFELYDRIYLDPKTGKPKMQNGGEMKFYQEGLDWKPKNISKDGSWLDKFQEGGNTSLRSLMDNYDSSAKSDATKVGKEIAPNKVVKSLDEKEFDGIKKSIYDQVSFVRDWMDSPMYSEMVDNSTTGIVDKYYLNRNRENNIGNVNFKIHKTSKPNSNAGADSNSDTGEIRIYPKGYQGPQLEGAIAHEVSHSSDRPQQYYTLFERLVNNPYSNSERNIPQKDIKLMQSYYKGNDYYTELFNNNAIKDDTLKKERKWFNYVGEPTETRARLNDIRYNAKKYNIYDPFTEKVTPEKLNEIKKLSKKAKGFDPFNQLRDLYSEDQIINMLNTISQNNTEEDQSVSMAKNGIRQEQKEKNGGWLSKYEDGGIIEDDRGQWEHPGEITKINSNEITMQGVDYPVLGISDTGDMQMMQPGQDYTYEGESVTEYPMAQQGKKIQSKQPSLRYLMNNDDDLKSKSDATKVDKKQKNGGWLNKYAEGGEITEAPTEEYDIKEGDTLFEIARDKNIPLNTLANANKLENPDLIEANSKLIIPKQYKKELKFEEIPTTDNKKIVIDNFSKHYDYIVEGNKTYYKTKGGKTWADISDNKTAQSNLLNFLDKNKYWGGYGSGEKELLKTEQLPKEQEVQVNLPKLTPINTKAQADATQVRKELAKPIFKAKPSVFNDVTNYLKSEIDALEIESKKLQKELKGTVENLKSSVEEGVVKTTDRTEELLHVGINGIKRKFATYTGIDEDAKIDISKTNKPKTIDEYYGNKTAAEISAVVNVPDGSGRQFKQQVMPTSSIKFGVRNRGEYKDIKTDGLEITTFNPFTKDKFPDNKTVIAVDSSGNLNVGQYKDFKNNKNFSWSPTTMNYVTDITTDKSGKIVYKKSEKNPGYVSPVTNVIKDANGKSQGSLNILVNKNKNGDYYGSVQGGRILVKNPDTNETLLISGSMNHIKSEFTRIKGNSKYLEVYNVDNGTYSRGLSYKDKKLTSERLKSYDEENLDGGGNGLYIIDYKQPVNKFKEEYIKGMPNIRTEKDSSYKKGHPLKNEVKNIVLHHTAFTGPDAEKEVTAQYMTPGKNTSHIVIQKNGKRSVYASPEQVTFHSGESILNDKENLNDFSIGVEFQGDTNNQPLTQPQIESFVEYYVPIAKKYNLSLKDIVTHEMVRNNYLKVHPNNKDNKKFVETKPDVTSKEYQRILTYMKKNNLK